VPRFKQSQKDHDSQTLICLNNEHPEKIGLVEFLYSRNFDTFATFTTSKPLGLKAARRKMNMVAHEIGATYATDFFWCAEKFDVREGFHTHGLINWNAKHPEQRKASNSFLFDYWQTKYGRFNPDGSWTPGRITLDPIRGKYNAEYYVSKYITKSLTDFDFNFVGMDPPPKQKYYAGSQGQKCQY